MLSSNAAKSAAKTQADAANQASALENNQFQQTRESLQPFVGAGTNALTQLQAALGIGPGGNGQINPSAFTASPGYQFQLQTGLDAVQNSAARQGGVNSGNTLRSLNSFGQNVAAQNFQQYLGNLSGVANAGQSAANQTGLFGANNASQVGSNTIGAGNATAAGQIASNNALTGILNSLATNAQQGLQGYQDARYGGFY